MITASAVERAVECPSSFVLPQVRTTSEYAERGTSIHEFVRRVMNNPESREQALREVTPDAIKACVGFDVDRAREGLTEIQTEAAFVVDVFKGSVRFIGHNIDRKYGPLSKGEIGVTIDVLAMRNGRPLARDWKSGQYVGETSKHWQTRIETLAACLLHNALEADGELAYIGEDGSVDYRPHTFNQMELEADMLELQPIWDRVEKAADKLAQGIVPDVSVGDWCKYCPAKTACPAKIVSMQMLVRKKDDVATVGMEVFKRDLLAMPATDIGLAFQVAKDMKAMGKEIEDFIKELINSDGALPHPDDGYEWSEAPSVRPQFDKKAAYRLMRDHKIPEDQISALEYMKSVPTITRRKIK